MSLYKNAIIEITKCSEADALTIEQLMRTYDPATGVLDGLSRRAFAGAAKRNLAFLTTPFERPQDEEMRQLLIADAREVAQLELRR